VPVKDSFIDQGIHHLQRRQANVIK